MAHQARTLQWPLLNPVAPKESSQRGSENQCPEVSAFLTEFTKTQSNSGTTQSSLWTQDSDDELTVTH